MAISGKGFYGRVFMTMNCLPERFCALNVSAHTHTYPKLIRDLMEHKIRVFVLLMTRHLFHLRTDQKKPEGSPEQTDGESFFFGGGEGGSEGGQAFTSKNCTY